MPIVVDDLDPTMAPAAEDRGPASIWAADLDGVEPTDDDRARWAEEAAPDRELDPLLRAGDLGRCTDGNVCWSSPFHDLF
jgi:hypothetical protein